MSRLIAGVLDYVSGAPVKHHEGFRFPGSRLGAVVVIDSPAGLAKIDKAPTAIVYLTVDWSCQERDARRKFLVFAESLENEIPKLGISLFVLQEDQAFVRPWLESKLRCKTYYVGGYGGVIWLCQGELAAYSAFGTSDLDALTTKAFATNRCSPDRNDSR